MGKRKGGKRKRKKEKGGKKSRVKKKRGKEKRRTKSKQKRVRLRKDKKLKEKVSKQENLKNLYFPNTKRTTSSHFFKKSEPFLIRCPTGCELSSHKTSTCM